MGWRHTTVDFPFPQCMPLAPQPTCNVRTLTASARSSQIGSTSLCSFLCKRITDKYCSWFITQPEKELKFLPSDISCRKRLSGVSIMQVKLVTGSFPKKKSSNCTHQSKIKGTVQPVGLHRGWTYLSMCSACVIGLAFWSSAWALLMLWECTPLPYVAFDLCYAPSISRPVQTVNEIEMERQAHSGRDQFVRGLWLCGSGVAPPTQEVGCVTVMWNVEEVMVCPSVLSRLCCNSGIVCGLPVVCQNFLENGHPWATEWCCCGCVLAHSSWPNFLSIEDIKCTLQA